ncbi:MAG: hypothetical protein CSB44_12575 [Gammaproteobacteria bacterium]|nr:MAG: hypothetical protein CSB44_12575 [Gammaproteobacteria bacterium]
MSPTVARSILFSMMLMMTASPLGAQVSNEGDENPVDSMASDNGRDDWNRFDVTPAEAWLDTQYVRHSSNTFLLHLRTLHERAVTFPEAVDIIDDSALEENSLLVRVEGNTAILAALTAFERSPLLFKGAETGKRYELTLRASQEGLRRPITILK